MELLRYQGKILYVGSSNFAGWDITAAQEAARQRNLLGLLSEQAIYNLCVRDVEREVLPAAAHYGLGTITWSPLQGGLLGGAARKAREGSRRSEGRTQETLEQRRARIESYEDFCNELGAEPGVVALAWLLSRPGVAAPIIGPRTPGQLESALGALDLALDDKALSRLDAIFPGYKASPEDFAW